MTIIIALASLHGGTGKTTICHYLGGALANDGSKVLLVDCDPSHGLTSLLTASDEYEYRSPWNKDDVLRKDHIQKSRYAKLSWIRECSELNQSTRIPLKDGQAWDNVETLFHERVREYDFVLLDCPSGHGRRARGCILMASLVLIPTKAEPSGVRGVKRTIRWICGTLLPARGSIVGIRVVVNLRHVKSVDTTHHESLLREDSWIELLPTTVPALEAFKRPARVDKDGKMIRANTRHKDPLGVMSGLFPHYMKQATGPAKPSPSRDPGRDEPSTGESASETYPLA